MLWRAARADALNEDGVSIGEISAQLGYTDRSHFGRDYKKYHGLPALRRRRRRRDSRRRRRNS